MSEWVIDWERVEGAPKWKLQEIEECKHEWWVGETVAWTPVRVCIKCGVPCKQVGDDEWR